MRGRIGATTQLNRSIPTATAGCSAFGGLKGRVGGNSRGPSADAAA
jgi:hypothetical protein